MEEQLQPSGINKCIKYEVLNPAGREPEAGSHTCQKALLWSFFCLLMILKVIVIILIKIK